MKQVPHSKYVTNMSKTQLQYCDTALFSSGLIRRECHLHRPRGLHPALQLQTHQHRGDPLVQAADPSTQLLLPQRPVRTAEQALQWEDILVQPPHPSGQRLPASEEGQSSGQGQVQVLHEHAEGQPGNVCQPGAKRFAQTNRASFLPPMINL